MADFEIKVDFDLDLGFDVSLASEIFYGGRARRRKSSDQPSLDGRRGQVKGQGRGNRFDRCLQNGSNEISTWASMKDFVRGFFAEGN